MSAERLREAAKVLRERAEGAGCEFGHQWRVDGMYQIVTSEPAPGGAPLFGCMACEYESNSAQYAGHPYTTEDTAAYIATVHPGVGLALADWLDCYAAVVERRHPIAFDNQALAIADAILGGGAS